MKNYIFAEVKGFNTFGMTEGANIQYYLAGGGYFASIVKNIKDGGSLFSMDDLFK